MIKLQDILFNERKLSSHQKKAILIAIEMSGNMTGATKKIEKIKKGLSNDKKVKDALRLANESVNESGILYRAGVKKYGKEGMRKIQQAAGKKLKINMRKIKKNL